MTRAATARAFFAFEIPQVVRAELEKARTGIPGNLPLARWTRPESWHLTVKFLGETETTVLERLTAELGPRLASGGRVTVKLSGGGFFPSPTRPRVAWIGGTAEGSEVVVKTVEAAAVRAGFAAEKRPWSVHLTMARLRSQWPRGAVDVYLDWAAGLPAVNWVCREIVLFESRLQPGGAVYTALERIPLE